METTVTYYATDGRAFNNLKRLEYYERALVATPHTIEYLYWLLLSHDGYATGIVMGEHAGQPFCQTFVTTCLDDWLSDFTDVSALTTEQRYIDSSTERCALVLRRKYAKEDACQYIFLVSKSVGMTDCELLYNANPRLLKKLAKAKETAEMKKKEVIN